MKISKSLLLIVSISFTAFAFADNSYINTAESVQSSSPEVTHNSLGIATVYNQNIYSGIGNKVNFFPLFNLSYDDFYLKGMTLGYEAYKNTDLSFDLIIQPFFDGYSSSDSAQLEGMSDTSYLVNTGAQVQYRLFPFSATLAALHDVSGRSNGNSASLKLAASVPLDDRRFVLIPSITALWQSSDITNYYYGVSENEATSSRPQYSPASALNTTYGLTLKYELSKHFGATLGYNVTKYANAISSSPIVSRSTSSAVLAGLSYIF